MGFCVAPEDQDDVRCGCRIVVARCGFLSRSVEHIELLTVDSDDSRLTTARQALEKEPDTSLEGHFLLMKSNWLTVKKVLHSLSNIAFQFSFG